MTEPTKPTPPAAKAAAKEPRKPDAKKIAKFTVKPGRSVITAEHTFIGGEVVELDEVTGEKLILEGHVEKGTKAADAGDAE